MHSLDGMNEKSRIDIVKICDHKHILIRILALWQLHILWKVYYRDDFVTRLENTIDAMVRMSHGRDMTTPHYLGDFGDINTKRTARHRKFH